MTKEELRIRSKAFALRVMKLVDALPNRRSAVAIGNQLVRSGTAVGANYRAAWRGRSRAEFTAKLGVVGEEADESCYCLELISEGALLNPPLVLPLLNESNELPAIFSASHGTLRRTNRKEHRAKRLTSKSRIPELLKSRNL